MDEIKIKTPLMRKLVSSIIKRTIKKRFGILAAVDLKDLTAITDETNATVHIELNAQMTKEEFNKLVKLIK